MKRPRKLAVVTGASGGLGLEFARLLARDGYDLALVARSQEKLESVARELRERHGASVETVVLDLAQADAAGELVRRVPQCDVLVNNAGFANNGKFAALPQDHIAQELQLDVVTLTELCRLYLPQMLERKSGKILNIASTAGFVPGPNMAVYYASKAYVISFSEAL
ncbi:MAG: SDR family NAD(P)-dependent oxidoreductase, partial [Candidatus Eremiobacteraeota bacterium]|nr:SDR family NAD(P)-dependent oxidoreductase [Candidatus Eremiobacteraeota bacterium]